MHLNQLFEKRERNQLILVSLLMEQPEEAHLKDILEKTSLSRSTLLKYIKNLNHLAKEKDFDLAVKVENDILSLAMGHQVTKEDLVQLMLPFSVKIKILNYLYLKNEFTVQKLSQELFISEATLHRQLASLNECLEEFGISIKNGRLRGEEHQIRYFYYQLYWLIVPKKEMSERFDIAQFEKIINTIKMTWVTDISTTNEYKLALWFSITKKRIRIENKNFKTLKKQMKIYQNHRFYLQLRQQTLRYLSRYALEVEEEEVMSQFIFITTMSILSPHVMERKLGYGGPVSDATTIGLRFIRSIVPSGENLNEQGMYTLNQVLGQLYFFKGALIDRSYRLDEGLTIIGSQMTSEHEKLAEEMIREVAKEVYGLKTDEYGDLFFKMRWSIMEVLSYVIYQTPRSIVIGVDLAGSETERLPILTVLRQHLEVNRLVMLEPWQEKKSFDFVISNVYSQTYESKIYYLKGEPNPFDIHQLDELINTYLTDKKQDSKTSF